MAMPNPFKKSRLLMRLPMPSSWSRWSYLTISPDDSLAARERMPNGRFPGFRFTGPGHSTLARRRRKIVRTWNSRWGVEEG